MAAAHAAHAAGSHSRRASDVIREANRKATEGPTPEDYFNAIMTYDYAAGTLFQIYTAPEHLTDVQLQPGEHLVGKPAIGDNVRWVLARGASSSAGSEQQHIYIKPTRPDLETTLALNTDRRSYILELHSYDDTYMAAVAWRYPQDDAAQLEADSSSSSAGSRTRRRLPSPSTSSTSATASPSSTAARNGSQPRSSTTGTKPSSAFLKRCSTAKRPRSSSLSSTGDTQLVNYRVKNDTYVVDRLFESAELRLGQKNQEIVRIIRTR